MGGIWSRLRAKPSTKELLEDLEKEIESLEEYKRSTEQQQKRIIGSLVFYFIVLFIMASAFFVIYYYPKLLTTKDKVLYCLPLLIVPVIFFLLKKLLRVYFHQKIKHNEDSLSELKRRRRSLLEYAMETETYKVVKELLEKYDTDYKKKLFELTPAIEAPPPVLLPLKGTFGETELRKRAVPVKAIPIPVIPGHHGNAAVRSPVQAMARPVLPRERTLVDRFVDYLVGDGPSNRYALICRQCQSHNGMAMREEFEFVAFRCCYCFQWNPPRNQQTIAPARLPLPSPVNSPPTVTEVTTPSSNTGIEDTCDGRSSPCTLERPSSPQKGQSSPLLRRRFNESAVEEEDEISAVLEEDRTKFSCPNLPSVPID